ncbi:alpha/beta-hydrolase [Setomelanomma holmii]|uniref:Alpha/beta-hydrolase n=1 Tax=Setomelanomma holmii TaxID=210430 RepID=A0A9P4H5V1_9PLEO|nr:alpha/beta-hydrolase [Setomelanomma holmii]
MASGPMQQCCVSGVLHEGTPMGEITNITDKMKHAIVLLTDVYGHTFRNSQLLADHFALNGYLTIIPDMFNGNEVPFPVPAGWSLKEYMNTTMPRVKEVDPIVSGTVEWLRREKGVERVGAAGYCFGGKYVVRWLKEGGVDAGFIAHPSFVDKEEIEGIQGPFSIAAAATDAIYTVPLRHDTEAILTKHNVPWQSFVYGGTEHGFAVRGNMMEGKARFAKEQAFKQAVGWFDEFVKGGKEA